MGNDYPPFFESKATFDAIVGHWAKARIDVPMQTLGRFDDAAKQLITLGSIWQGIYIGIFTFGNLKHQIPVWLLGVAFIPLVLVIIFAAQAICTVPLKKEAFGTYSLFKNSSGLSDEQLTTAVDEWCQAIDGIANEKHKWLNRAKYSLIINSFASLALMIALMWM